MSSHLLSCQCCQDSDQLLEAADGYLTPQAIYIIVKEHVPAMGLYNRKGDATLAARDLRRTTAALALKGGADLRQIQHMLGHASITTTERCLEPMHSLQVTAGDFIQIELALTMGR